MLIFIELCLNAFIAIKTSIIKLGFYAATIFKRSCLILNDVFNTLETKTSALEVQNSISESYTKKNTNQNYICSNKTTYIL